MIQVSKYLDNVYVLQDRAMSNAILVIGKKKLCCLIQDVEWII